MGTTADALKAIDVLRAEIDNLGEQNGRLEVTTHGWNCHGCRTEAIDDTGEALSQVGGTDFTADLIELSKTRIERHQNAARHVDPSDIVNLLI